MWKECSERESKSLNRFHDKIYDKINISGAYKSRIYAYKKFCHEGIKNPSKRRSFKGLMGIARERLELSFYDQ